MNAQTEMFDVHSKELKPGQSVETVNARDLWTHLESQQEFANWIKARIEKYGFTEGVDYVFDKFINNPLGGRPALDCHISIDMAKELAMVENNQRGRDARRYFIERDNLMRQVQSSRILLLDMDNPASILDTITTFATRLGQEQVKVAKLESTVTTLAPKAAALDRIANSSDGSFCIMDAAKCLRVKPKFLFGWLNGNGWIYRRSGSPWIAYQERIKSGFLEHRVKTVACGDGMEKIAQQVRLTPKGMTHLSTALNQTESCAADSN